MTACTCKILTHSPIGHMLHHNGVFSRDGEWIVFDGRNDDTKIGETSLIGLVNIFTGEEKSIYETQNPTVYGPGIGAVSFSPTNDTVVFIHGLPDANSRTPYSVTRRTGVGIDLARQFQPIMLDARDTKFPYTPGSLRGGTHSHGWSGDGKLISFTYNDEFAEPDLRTVGVMIPYKKGVKVESGIGNNSGTMYAAIVSKVVLNPALGSDEINRAFDECWLGSNGYKNKGGTIIPYSLAFQGNVINTQGEQITEVFVIDIDPSQILEDAKAVGLEGERPQIPKGITQRRLTFSQKGISRTRHWLRSSPDGKYLFALVEDQKGFNQISQINVLTGETVIITQNDFSIFYTFNLNIEGNKLCFVAENSVNILNLKTKQVERLNNSFPDSEIVGSPSFSPDGTLIVYNQYLKHVDGKLYLQIGIVQVS